MHTLASHLSSPAQPALDSSRPGSAGLCPRPPCSLISSCQPFLLVFLQRGADGHEWAQATPLVQAFEDGTTQSHVLGRPIRLLAKGLGAWPLLFPALHFPRIPVRAWEALCPPSVPSRHNGPVQRTCCWHPQRGCQQVPPGVRWRAWSIPAPVPSGQRGSRIPNELPAEFVHSDAWEDGFLDWFLPR